MQIAILLFTSMLATEDPRPLAEKSDPQAPVDETTRWYGWQTLLADAAPVTLFALAELKIASEGGDQSKCPECSALFVATFATYLVVAPLVHASHGRGWTAVADFGLRLGIPTVGGLLGAALFAGKNGLESTAGAVLGATAGLVTAVIVDATVLAYEPVDAGSSVSAKVGWILDPEGRKRPVLVLAGAF